jgi:hypothetical protein
MVSNRPGVQEKGLGRFFGDPVELTAVEVGPGQRGREKISLDISQYGDPLDTRSARVPYSRYLKSERQSMTLGEQIAKLPPIFEIPLFENECGRRAARDA